MERGEEALREEAEIDREGEIWKGREGARERGRDRVKEFYKGSD